MTKRKTMDSWIADCIAESETDGRGKISRIMLVHMQAASFAEVYTYRFGGTHSVTEKELANVFRGKAETYAQDLNGSQMFQVHAFYATNEPEAKFNLKVVTAVDPMANGLMTEPPDATGQTMQGMRHKEALVGQVYQRQQKLDDHSLRIIELQGNQIAHLMDQNFQQFNMLKDTLLAMADKRHEYEMKQLQSKRAAEREAQFIKMAPALVNSFTGKQVFPQSSEDTALISAIAENITEEQFGMIGMLGLPDTILGPLSARIAKALNDKKAKRDERAALPVYRGDPEKDIEGGGE